MSAVWSPGRQGPLLSSGRLTSQTFPAREDENIQVKKYNKKNFQGPAG